MKNIKIGVTVPNAAPMKYPLFLNPVSSQEVLPLPPRTLTTTLKVPVPHFQNTRTYQTRATSFSEAFKLKQHSENLFLTNFLVLFLRALHNQRMSQEFNKRWSVYWIVILDSLHGYYVNKSYSLYSLNCSGCYICWNAANS